MLDSKSWVAARLPDGMPPLIGIVVDTEEEFDWSRPVSRAEIGVTHVKHQRRAHGIFDRYGVKPTYVVDYAIASQELSYQPLRDLVAERRCEIGAHLHPWVNPPFVEEVSARNSYPGNLPKGVERDKLAALTELIERKFGDRPIIYRAGRYGVGPASADLLEELGYEIDTSVVPRSDFRRFEGPDFRHCAAAPYWFGRRRKLLEIPLTVSWIGLLRVLGSNLHGFLQSELARRLHIGGILARLRLAERIALSPEGMTFDELRRLTSFLASHGHRLFIFSYHSPSLVPGHTPYVRDSSGLERFLDTIDRYLAYFVGELQGRPSTLSEMKALVSEAARGAGAPATAPARR
jgi:peptidoglycan/xylan/chitin deacetylase (PgdA/CDA1 family)